MYDKRIQQLILTAKKIEYPGPRFSTAVCNFLTVPCDIIE